MALQATPPQKLVLVSVNPKQGDEDKQPLLEKATEKEEAKAKKDRPSNDKGTQEKQTKVEKSNISKSGVISKRPNERVLTANSRKRSHESKVSYWKEKEEKYRAREWKGRQDSI